MLKKIFVLSTVFCMTLNSALADDFHRLYKPLTSDRIKTGNFEELNRIPLKVKAIADVSTKKDLTEGQKIIFLTTEDTVLRHNRVLAAGSRVFGTVETVSKNEMKGVPANLIVGDFKIEYMSTVKLEGEINKEGANRAIWVRPLLPLLFPVRGGHAKINADEIFTLYYTPTSI